MNSKKQLAINMISSLLAFGISLVISFLLSPFIVETIGVEANGFVTLANNFASYASLLSIALNSMAGRFVTISIIKDEKDETNTYFSSLFFANIFLGMCLTIIGAVIIASINNIIKIPEALIADVRLVFIAVFLNSVLSIVGSVFSIATFAKNMLYLESLRNIEANIIRAVVIVGLYSLLSPKIFYIGIGTLLSSVYILICNIYFTKKLLPDVEINTKKFDVKIVFRLISAGIWNAINRLGQILIDGLDLLITNIFIDATSMGILSLAKTVPSLISSLIGSAVGVFSPNYTILFAQEQYDELVTQIKQSMRIMGILANLPIIVLVVCGRDFFQCWQPTQNATMLQILSILTVACLVFSGGINCLYSVFTVVNKVKQNSLIVLLGGALSTLIVLVLVKKTTLGVYAVAGVSTIVSIVRNLFFTAPYGAKCLNQKWYIFYPDIFRPVLFFVVSTIVSTMIVDHITVPDWLGLTLKATITVSISSFIAIFVMLGKKDRKLIISKLRSHK